MTFRLGLACVLLLVLVPGCPTAVPEGVYRCTPANVAMVCGPTWYCRADGFCWLTPDPVDAAMLPDGGPFDAGMPDAARSDAAIPDTGTDAATDDTGIDAPMPIDAYVDDAPVILDDGCVLGTYYRDGDGDNYGQLSMPMQACSMPTGYAGVPGDCNDGNGAIHPGVADTCNGLDDDCSGTADDMGTLECVMGQPTSCSTTCGSMGTGFCSTACTRPTGASCTHPATETTCDGLDDDCNGVADEGFGSVGAPVTGIANGGTTATQYASVRLVPSDSGFAVFAGNQDFPGRIFMQALRDDGSPSGAIVPLDSRITTGLVALSALHVTGGFVLAYGAWNPSAGPTGPVTFAFVDTTGTLRCFGTLAPPAGYDGAWQRVVLVPASSGASRVVVYANMRVNSSTAALALRRYLVDFGSSSPTVVSEGDVATNLEGDVFDVAVGAPDEWIVYRTTTSDVRLIRFNGTAMSIGSITSGAPVAVGIALGLAAPVSFVNPLAIVWQDNSVVPSPTTHVVEVSSTAPFTLGTAIALPGGGAGFPGNAVQIAPAPNESTGPHLGHWFVTHQLRVWDVLGNSGAPTATNWTPADRTDTGVVIAARGGARLAHLNASYDVVTRRLGCR